MLFEQDDKLRKQDIKSFEQHSNHRNKLKNKTRMSLHGSRPLLPFCAWFLKIFTGA